MSMYKLILYLYFEKFQEGFFIIYNHFPHMEV